MTKTTRWLVSSVALLALSTPAVAQEWVEGWYAEVGGGLSILPDIDATRAGSNITLQNDEGFMLSGALGRQFRNVHVEVEALYFQNDFRRSAGFGKVSGDVSVYGAMANLFYDFDFGRKWRPYLGAGFGMVQASFNDVSGTGLSNIDDKDDALAYQFRAGISYSLNSAMDLVLDYRYLITEDLDFWSSAGGVLTSTDGLEQHGIQARIRIRY